MTFTVGSLVKARGREWVVLPDSTPDLLMVRPLGGVDDEITGIYLPIEQADVRPATFDLPDPSKVGDFRSCRLLRDAVRLSTRAGAGPLRCFARIAVEPRPYQIVPLLMALKLDPVRILIADDVGVGKSVEAGLIAREFLDRGEISRLAVLCPPHLAEQWQTELKEKFHIDAELVLPGTAARLERACRVGQSLFEIYPYTVVSMDFIKSDRHRNDFVRAAPELLLVDEAHTCSFGFEGRGGRHQRHQLIRQLAANPERHIVLVTAVPHSGKEEAFRSLLSFLNPDFAALPSELGGPENERHRRRLAAHFIQRTRADIRHFMRTDTPFPDREDAEDVYRLTSEYKRLFVRVLEYARETVRDESGGRHRQRVRWWSVLALLRSLASSPAAAAATLRNRADVVDSQSVEEADEIGRRSVFDADSDDLVEGIDLAPGANPGEESASSPLRRRLLDMAREADALRGDQDAKLTRAVDHIKRFLRDGFHPIVFCRFIPTAEYVAEELRRRLAADRAFSGVNVVAVTGMLPPADREARVQEMAASPRRVLVCTDCLSEGINLQHHFDAVLHYDLGWSPTRHEQREGRVDRYGQKRTTVRVLTYYGLDNQIDGIVLDILIKKHKTIRHDTGISVPVPTDTNTLTEAIFEGLLLREQSGTPQDMLPGLEEYLKPKKEDLYKEWDNAAAREKRSRTMFAQESIKVDEVARELAESRAAAGSAEDVAAFTTEALRSMRAVVSSLTDRIRFDLRETPRALRDLFGGIESFEARSEFPVDEGVIYLSRTHPYVEALASHVLDTALDPVTGGVAARAGVIRTRAVRARTHLLLVRFRFDLVTRQKNKECSQLAEECRIVAFQGSPDNPVWLDEAAAESLLRAEPHGNIQSEQASDFVRRVVDAHDRLRPLIEREARVRAAALLESHTRVREAARIRGLTYRVEPQLPADVLGIYVFLPAT